MEAKFTGTIDVSELKESLRAQLACLGAILEAILEEGESEDAGTVTATLTADAEVA